MAPSERPDGGGDLATRIRRRRGALGLTGEEVAAEPGWTRATSPTSSTHQLQ